jgi:hypothetical protein
MCVNQLPFSGLDLNIRFCCDLKFVSLCAGKLSFEFESSQNIHNVTLEAQN